MAVNKDDLIKKLEDLKKEVSNLQSQYYSLDRNILIINVSIDILNKVINNEIDPKKEFENLKTNLENIVKFKEALEIKLKNKLIEINKIEGKIELLDEIKGGENDK